MSPVGCYSAIPPLDVIDVKSWTVEKLTHIEYVGEVDASERRDVGEIAFPLPVKQVALQGFGEQDPAVVRGVHGPEVGVWDQRGTQPRQETS